MNIQKKRDASPAAFRSGNAPHRTEHPNDTLARLLRAMERSNGFLFFQEGTGRGGVFGPAKSGSKPLAQADGTELATLLSRSWVVAARRKSGGSGKGRYYSITQSGRVAIARLSALSEDRAVGAEKIGAGREGAKTARKDTSAGRRAESPLAWLSRRRGPDGKPFMPPEAVEAAERLRRDYAIATAGPHVTLNWRRFLALVDESAPAEKIPFTAGAEAAKKRLSAALAALGSDLGDVAVRICCMEQGLEEVEREMGWSARSGKIVLRIALKRLVAHYGLVAYGRRNGRILRWSSEGGGPAR